jgi:CubicO group peptidase (beta-lactamase class C family)
MVGPSVRPLALLAVILIALAPDPARAQHPALRGLDAYVERGMRDWEVPGLAIAVVKDDSVIFARGYGVREAGRADAVDEHTLFAIASTTKAMTAAVLGMLVDDGALRWDDPVHQHLTGFVVDDPYLSRELTVRDLLTHRSGLARNDMLWIAAPFDRAEILRRARHLPRGTGFRERYGYNNIMYIAAGELAGAVARGSWDDLVEQRLFQPLGMSRSTTRAAVVATRHNVSASHVRVDGRVQAIPRRDYDNLGGAGSAFSTAHEMAQWMRLHLGGGAYRGERLLAEATVKEMHTPQMVMRMDSVAERLFPTNHFRAYGLGWYLRDHHGRKMVHHSGSVNWTGTQVGMIPAEGLGVVVISNLSSSDLAAALMYRVLDALLDVPERDWSGEYLELARRAADLAEQRLREEQASRVHGTRPSLPLARYAGTYEDPLYGEARVVVENGRLALYYAPDYTADLEHWHHDTFRATWRRTGFGSALVTFSLDAGAQVESADVAGLARFRRTAGAR